MSRYSDCACHDHKTELTNIFSLKPKPYKLIQQLMDVEMEIVRRNYEFLKFATVKISIGPNFNTGLL